MPAASDKRERVDPTTLHHDDALNLAIGKYIIEFAGLDFRLAIIAALLLKIDLQKMFFVFKDIFTDQKIKIVRRAAIDTLEKDKSDALCSTLNKINKRSEFRNSLLHGHFVKIGGPEGKFAHGKMGKSISDMMRGIEEIEASTLENETKLIWEIIQELGDFITSWVKPKS